jgi:hypothetical protein
MTSKRPAPKPDSRPDFRHLPGPVDPATLVETHDVDPITHEPDSKFATPEIEVMARTGAIGAGF